MNILLRSNQHGFSLVGIYCELVSDTPIVNLYYYRIAVRKKLSSKFDVFIAIRQRSIRDLCATLFAFVLCFLRQKIINNAVFRHRCDVYAAVFPLDVATAIRQINR